MGKSIKGFLEGVVAALVLIVMASAVLVIGFAVDGVIGASVAIVLAFVVAMGLVGATSS